MPSHPLMKFESGVNEQMGLHLHVASKTDSYLWACIKYSPTFITIILPKQVNLSTWRVMGMQQWSCINFFFSFCNKTLSVPARKKRFCLWIKHACEWELIVPVIRARPVLIHSRSGMCCYHPDQYGGIIILLAVLHFQLGYCLHVGLIYQGIHRIGRYKTPLHSLLCEGNKLHGSSLQVSTQCIFTLNPIGGSKILLNSMEIRTVTLERL